VVEDCCRSKGRFEELKSVLTLQRADPRGVVARKPSEWDGDTGVRGDKPSIEACETQERLDVHSISWCRPITDDLDLRGVHLKAVRAKNGTEEDRRVHAESALLGFGV